jgi:hypothetical protein
MLLGSDSTSIAAHYPDLHDPDLHAAAAGTLPPGSG